MKDSKQHVEVMKNRISVSRKQKNLFINKKGEMSKRQLPERQKNGEMEKRKKGKKDKKGKKQFSYIHYLYIFTNLSIIFLTHFHNLEIILVILTGRKIKRIHLQTAVDFVFIFFPSFLFDFHLQYFI